MYSARPGIRPAAVPFTSARSETANPCNVNARACFQFLFQTVTVNVECLYADSELFGRSSHHVTALRALLSFDRPERRYQRRTRLLMPYLVANPVRVTSGQLRDYRLGQEARRRSTTANDESSARNVETTSFASDGRKP